MSDILADFIDRARNVSLETVAELVGADVKGTGDEKVGPCPIERDGKDRFAINCRKGLWHCRGCGTGGDAMKLYAMANDYDLGRRSGLLAVCSELLNEPVPDEGEAESAEDKAAREERRRKREAETASRKAKREKEDNAFREREIGQARGIYKNGREAAGSVVETYLRRRCGISGPIPAGVFAYLKVVPKLTYWHGKDDFGRPASLFEWPAMVAPFVTLERQIIGCHQTWIDLDRPATKFRPVIYAPTRKGVLAGRRALINPPEGVPNGEDIDAALYERLPPKKMRGKKQGGLIPVCGLMAAPRWVVGEGIETVLAVAHGEGYREDSFYCAAGDLGNMAGPADGTIAHPTMKKQDVKGRWRATTVPSPVPRPASDADAMPVADHVTALVLLADGDSEPVFTTAAMMRAEARHGKEGRTITVEWPPEGYGDFADACADEMA